MSIPTQGLRVDQSLDVRALCASEGYQKARELLEKMEDEQILELHVEEGEVLRSLPFGLRAEGHEILVSEPIKQGIRLLVRKRGQLPEVR